MNETRIMTIFSNPEFGQVRAAIIGGEPWFVATDVCQCLDIGNSRQALSRLDDDEKGVISNDTHGGRQDVSAVNEPGLYKLVLSSRKPDAEVFKRWVTHDVIPSIRKTGGYMTSAATEQLQTLLVSQQALITAQQEKLERLEHYVVKIGKNLNYTNYFLLCEFGSGTKSGWKNTVSARLKVIEDATSIGQLDQLNAVYTYMKNRFGVDWDRHRELYSKVHGVDKPSTLDVVCASDILMGRFDEAMDDLFGRLELPIPEVPEPKMRDDPFDALVARAQEHRQVASL